MCYQVWLHAGVCDSPLRRLYRALRGAIAMKDARARRVALCLVVSPAVAIGGLAADARARRDASAKDEPAIEALARRLPTSDLALSGGARWLRAVSLEDPSAAFADGPALPDPDPAGAAMAPPVEVWRAMAVDRGRE